MEHDHDVFKSEKRAFYNRLRKLWLNPNLGRYLDDGKIDHMILDALIGIVKNKGKVFWEGWE
jgi:hypothetical protein